MDIVPQRTLCRSVWCSISVIGRFIKAARFSLCGWNDESDVILTQPFKDSERDGLFFVKFIFWINQVAIPGASKTQAADYFFHVLNRGERMVRGVSWAF